MGFKSVDTLHLNLKPDLLLDSDSVFDKFPNGYFGVLDQFLDLKIIYAEKHLIGILHPSGMDVLDCAWHH